MIDIHCHILPGIDDGAKHMSETIGMAKKAVEEGIHTIIATPHHKNGKYENTKTDIIQMVREANAAIQGEGIPLKLLAGQETRIYGEYLEDYQKDELLPLAESQYVFIELPSGHVPRYTEQLLFDIQMKELVPIIVHPERNSELIERPDRLYQLVKKGALTQVTAGSLCGYFGKKIKSFSHQLIEANLTHFIASDAHNLKSRSFMMAEAIDLVDSKFGDDMVYLFTENAELLVNGRNVMKEIPERVKRKKFLGLF
ncbi:tyrosine-protein phosphatase [Cytobacillus sp. NCCP-133]|uniref:tyrosine-protein phosphatase n=1 Tax=Cytobacillus sp. NCCP-133 TaxID=766848 RepID=UPI0022315A8D|nr:CpsB/CapC family capsule biosynthesis tyrosine phosphatase [Cytobacillus sp. NCCP-133]GLB58991.1 tyrosine protein phosphatase [Cytobacillus sp. NCCP-133]